MRDSNTKTKTKIEEEKEEVEDADREQSQYLKSREILLKNAIKEFQLLAADHWDQAMSILHAPPYEKRRAKANMRELEKLMSVQIVTIDYFSKYVLKKEVSRQTRELIESYMSTIAHKCNEDK